MKQETRKFWILFCLIHFIGIAGNILLYHFGLPNSIDSILESFRKQEYYLLFVYGLCYAAFCFLLYLMIGLREMKKT